MEEIHPDLYLSCTHLSTSPVILLFCLSLTTQLGLTETETLFQTSSWGFDRTLLNGHRGTEDKSPGAGGIGPEGESERPLYPVKGRGSSCGRTDPKVPLEEP